MATIEEIVNVTITQNTLAVSQQGFGVPLILSANKGFIPRIKYYANLSEVANDFSTISEEYEAASLAFGQSVKPELVAIGRIETSNTLNMAVSQAIENYDYSVTIQGDALPVTVTYTSTTGQTLNQIMTALVAAINADVDASAIVSATGGTGGNFTLSPAFGVTDYAVKPGTNVTSTTTSSQTAVDALNEIVQISNDWFGLVILQRDNIAATIVFNADFIDPSSNNSVTINGVTSDAVTFTTDQETTLDLMATALADHPDVLSATAINTSPYRSIELVMRSNKPLVITASTPALVTNTPTTTKLITDILDVAAWAETQKKIFITASSDPAILVDPDTTSIAYWLKNEGYSHTAIMYHSEADSTWPEAAWLGRMLPTQPGAATWKFKTLAGVTNDSLTTDQSRIARDIKSANTYERIGGINITREGVMSNGNFIDVIVGVFWLESRIEERIYQKLTQLDKVPFTDAGIAIIEGELRAQLEQAVDYGLITPDYVIQVPKAADVPLVDKAARLLPDVRFSAVLSGAVHRIFINGIVSI